MLLCIFVASHAAKAQSADPAPGGRRVQDAPRPGVKARGDTMIYATPQLQQLVATVAALGRETPPALRGYRVNVESEIALVLRTAAAREGSAAADGGDAAGRERVLQVEQVESTLGWERGGVTDQHVVGHRLRAITANVSALSYFRRPWVVPILYGNRLQVVFGHEAVGGADTSPASEPGEAAETGDHTGRDALLAVHPFADDRDAVYRFSGGDTVAVLNVQGRTVPIVRVMVEPYASPARRTLLFRGELDIDGSRHQVVRMRGQFVILGPRQSLLRRVSSGGWQTVAFAELVNGEFDGQFWLPTEQRLEGQGRSPLASDFRPIVRVVSRFRGYALSLSADGAEPAAPARAPVALLTFAPRDSLNAFAAWHAEIGAATAQVRANDFDDVAPDSWRPRGPPRVDWRAERLTDVFRFNRVEGAFTGAAATLRLRDAVPGLELGAYGGWAWAERTARATAWARWSRRTWTYAARAGRELANTNDVRPLLDYEQSLMALLATADDYDYLDRRSASVSAARALHIAGAPRLRAELGVGSDHGEQTRVRYGLVHLDSAFRRNRPIAPGSYVRSAVALDLHPGVSGEFLEPGIGAGLSYERGDGGLRWQRVEARVTARHTRGPFTYSGRLDGLAMFSRDTIPQQLFELGENEGLQGYAYKEFGGDRVVLARAAIAYELPVLHAPIRLGPWSGPLSRFYLPGLSPSIAAGVQAAWADASTPAARAGLAQFGMRRDSTSGSLILATRPTGGVRSTMNVTLRLFGGTLGIGAARPLDRLSPHQGWRLVLGVGQPF